MEKRSSRLLRRYIKHSFERPAAWVEKMQLIHAAALVLWAVCAAVAAWLAAGLVKILGDNGASYVAPAAMALAATLAFLVYGANNLRAADVARMRRVIRRLKGKAVISRLYDKIERARRLHVETQEYAATIPLRAEIAALRALPTMHDGMQDKIEWLRGIKVYIGHESPIDAVDVLGLIVISACGKPAKLDRLIVTICASKNAFRAPYQHERDEIVAAISSLCYEPHYISWDNQADLVTLNTSGVVLWKICEIKAAVQSIMPQPTQVDPRGL